MRLTTQIKKLAHDALREIDPDKVDDLLEQIVVIADKMDARTGTIDPSRKKRGNKK